MPEKIGDNITFEQRDDISVLWIKNNLSYQTADELRLIYPRLQSDKILIDLGQVTLTTSRGMASVIRIVINAHENGQPVCFCNISPLCMNIIDAMDIMNHLSNLTLAETLDDGLAHFK